MSKQVIKPSELTKTETFYTFQAWKQKLLYFLRADSTFVHFVDRKWQKYSATNPHRGFADDLVKGTKEVQNSRLENMLEFVASYAPVISRNTIVKQSTSLDYIFQKLREHYGFQSSGANFLDLANIKYDPSERYEDLFQKLLSFFEDNLLKADSGVSHDGETITTDEDASPTLQNTIVFIWLQLIHQSLPLLVKQRYGPELRNKTLFSIKQEISQCIPTLLDEIRSSDDSRLMRTFTSNSNRKPFPDSNTRSSSRPSTDSRVKQNKQCPLCVAAKRPGCDTHFLSECKFLPERDRKFMARARQIEVDDLEEVEPDHDVHHGSELFFDSPEPANLRRVRVIGSPHMSCFYGDKKVEVTFDNGATSVFVSDVCTNRLKLKVSAATQGASTVDPHYSVDVIGETHFTLSRGEYTFPVHALVIRGMPEDVLAGNPFIEENDIGFRQSKKQIILQGKEVLYYDCSKSPSATLRRTRATLLRSPVSKTILPGEYLEVDVPDCDADYTLEPRYDCKVASEFPSWPAPTELSSVGTSLRIPNTSSSPILVRKGDHFCQIRRVVDFEVPAQQPSEPPNILNMVIPKSGRKSSLYSSEVSVNPDNMLPADIAQKFVEAHTEFDEVFNPAVSRYNGASGHIVATVNMGTTKPPQRKGRLPAYNRETLNEYQEACETLEAAGVLAKPEDVGVIVENVNLSFLVNKPGKNSKRFVTAFGPIGEFCRPSPSLMPSVDSVLRDIAGWKFLIVTDLKHAYFQIPLSTESMKYCGVVTPFKGVRVYTRAAMGMPGSETCLEELMSRVLGDLIQDGCVAKIADDLYVGGDTPSDLLANWIRVLQAMHQNNLSLCAPKTIIAPRSTLLLGWKWSSGTLQASTHRVSALQCVEPPTTVQSMRSFIGAYKVLGRVLKGHAALLAPLDDSVAGRQSREKIVWTEALHDAFSNAQKALANCKSITMPRPSDSVWIVTDATCVQNTHDEAQKVNGLAATMYVSRNDELLLAEFFNVKLKANQSKWLPCEKEALCISSAIAHFAPFIIQSHHTVNILTDSKPCVQAYQKLLRGEFSSSARVATFLSNASRYRVKISHIRGVSNIPTDYASRNPIECVDSSCQICKFNCESEEITVRTVTVSDIINGSARMPFTNRVAWLEAQHECLDLRRTYGYLVHGTRPQKKNTRVGDVKRYLRVASVASDGLLCVDDSAPFQRVTQRIIIPRSLVPGLLTAVHLRFSHPSPHQMKQLVSRYFFALDLDQSVADMCNSCHQCVSLKTVPNQLVQQSSEPPPSSAYVSYSADVMKQNRQLILVLRETVSSFTSTMLITSETGPVLREAVIQLSCHMRPHTERRIVIRTDPAPGFQSIVDDPMLARLNISIDIGFRKNKNKNPVIDRGIQELELELLRITPEGGPYSASTIAVATHTMNGRIRHHGLSAYEVFTQRDQISGDPIPVSDQQLILKQQLMRSQNHSSSALSKSRGKGMQIEKFDIGDIVYIKSESDKCKARDKYMVISISSKSAELRKFTSKLFRKQAYTVALHDILPVRSTTLRPPISHATSLCMSNDNPVPSDNPVSSDNSTESDSASALPRTSASDLSPLAPLVPQELPEELAPFPSSSDAQADPAPPLPASPPPIAPEPPDLPATTDDPDDEAAVSARPKRNRRPPEWQKDFDMY